MSVQEIFNTMEYGHAPESPTNAQAWLSSIDRKFKHFINGDWHQPENGCYFESNNPASGEFIAQVADGNATDVNLAVSAAKGAQDEWVKLGGHGRARYLYALARQIQKNSRLFSVLESIDNGKPIRESRDIDIPLVERHFYYHAGWAQVMDSELNGYQELGVVGQIIPWNFPLLMLAWKVAPALAMGNTVVLKPAEFTSATAVLFAEICQQINLPKGVFNLVLGKAEAGKAIADHPDIKKLAFTGSTEVGKILRKSTAGSGKKLSLELGGKSAFIVFEDADIDSAVEGLVDAIWFNQGQVCCAGSRLLVQESIAEKLYTKIKARMEKLVLGDSLDKNIDMGAIIDHSQLMQIKEKVGQGVKEGASLYQPSSWDKSSCKESESENTYYYPPTLLTQVEPAYRLAQEEIFGPVLVAMTFRTPKEAVQMANNSRYGLAVSLWSENINLTLDIAPQIKAGSVWINCTNHFDAASGFGGYRESGFGREGGKEGLFEYVQPVWEAKLLDQPLAWMQKPPLNPKSKKANSSNQDGPHFPSIDRTAKLYIGGKQVRPDNGYSLSVEKFNGESSEKISSGSRKDIRNAVEACNKAEGWTKSSAHLRAQVIYFMAENLITRSDEFIQRICELSGKDTKAAKQEFNLCISRIFTYAAMADKYDGDVHSTPFRNITLALKEAIGNIAIVAPEEGGLLGFISTLMPAIAMGNRVIIVPSLQSSLLATDFYQVLETSDVPAGVVNIITGERDALTETLAKHYDIEAFWYWGSQPMSRLIEYEAAATMKRTWVSNGKFHDWYNKDQGEGEIFLRKSTEIKNVWVPYGE